MDLESLEILLDSLHFGNFSDVARARDMAPSSVSRVITALEQELGFKLFQRSTRKLQATEAGLRYANRVRSIMGELDSAKQYAADVVEQPQGLLRITAPVVFGEMYVVPLLPRLSEAYPELTIELLLNDAYIDIIEERIDIAIRLGTLRDSSYIARQLSPLHFSICASPDYLAEHGTPDIPEQIQRHNCLLFPRSGYNLNWLFKNAQGEVKDHAIHGNCLITNSAAIRQCALAGMGLALLPNWLIQQDLDAGKLRALFNDYEVSATDFEAAIWMIYPSRDYTPKKTRVFIDLLSSHFAL